MKRIVKGKLYNTETATLITKFSRWSTIQYCIGIEKDTWVKSALYKTAKGAWFEVIGLDTTNPELNELTVDEAKRILRKSNPEKYMELWPDEVEEA